jgi:hypothetical protein
MPTPNILSEKKSVFHLLGDQQKIMSEKILSLHRLVAYVEPIL